MSKGTQLKITERQTKQQSAFQNSCGVDDTGGWVGDGAQAIYCNNSPQQQEIAPVRECVIIVLNSLGIRMWV